MKSSQFITESLSTYLAEDLRKDPVISRHIKRLDEGFYRPWVKHINEGMQLTPDQVSKLFTAAQQNADAGGANLTGLGKIVDKIIPDALLAKLFENLPEPDPNAQPDPQFKAKADAAIAGLPVDSQTKQGLSQVAAKAEGNPASHAIILSLLGGVLGGVLNKVGPALSVMIPGGGTAVAGITGAVVAGAVAVAAAKLQGKGWKEAFKGAVKPALAGAAGAVLGSLAAQFAGAAIDHFNKPADAETNVMPTKPDAPADIGDQEFPLSDTRTHQVQKGDTLSDLAKANGTTVDELARLNPEIKNVHNIQAGTEIKLPMSPGSETNPYGGAHNGLGSNRTDQMSMNPYSDQPQSANAPTGGNAPVKTFAPTPGTTTTQTSDLYIGNQPVVPGQPLSNQQMAAISMAHTMGNDVSRMYPAEVMKAYTAQGGQLPDTSSAAYKQQVMAPTPGQSSSNVFENRRRYIDREQTVRSWLLRESIGKPRGGVHLTNEGIGDMFKKAGQFIKTGVQNKLKSVTADKLDMAWRKAGNPPDSDLIYQIMQNAGVGKDILDKIYKEMNIPLPAGNQPAQDPNAAAAGAGAAPGAAGGPTGGAGGVPPAPGAGGAGAAPGAGGMSKADVMKAIDNMIAAIAAVKGKPKSAAIKYATEKLAGVKVKAAEPAAAAAAPAGGAPAPRPTGPQAVVPNA